MTPAKERGGRERLAGALEEAASHASYGGPKTPEGWEQLRDFLLDAAEQVRGLIPDDTDELREIARLLNDAEFFAAHKQLQALLSDREGNPNG